MHDINVKMAEIKELIEAKVRHPYINQYINTPKIDEDKLLLLYSIFKELKLPQHQIESYIITTMLVQIALDTHETVSNSSVLTLPNTLKNHQLTVLAGTYFSGLYYYLLADIDDINMIRTLAEAIKDINEHKIRYYQKDADHFDTLINTVEMIEVSLFRKITEFFHLPKWTELATKTLLLKRLMSERETFASKGYSILFDTMRNLFFPVSTNVEMVAMGIEEETYLLQMIDKYIAHLKQLIEKCLVSNQTVNKLLEVRVKELLIS